MQVGYNLNLSILCIDGKSKGLFYVFDHSTKKKGFDHVIYVLILFIYICVCVYIFVCISLS